MHSTEVGWFRMSWPHLLLLSYLFYKYTIWKCKSLFNLYLMRCWLNCNLKTQTNTYFTVSEAQCPLVAAYPIPIYLKDVNGSLCSAAALNGFILCTNIILRGFFFCPKLFRQKMRLEIKILCTNFWLLEIVSSRMQFPNPVSIVRRFSLWCSGGLRKAVWEVASRAAQGVSMRQCWITLLVEQLLLTESMAFSVLHRDDSGVFILLFPISALVGWAEETWSLIK